MAVWIHNDSSALLRSLSASQLVVLLRAAVRNADRLKRETNAAISQAAKDKLWRLEQAAQRTHTAEKKLIHDLLCLRHEILIKTTEQHESFRESVKDSDKKVLKELKKQIRLLHKVLVLKKAQKYSHTLYTHVIHNVLHSL